MIEGVGFFLNWKSASSPKFFFKLWNLHPESQSTIKYSHQMQPQWKAATQIRPEGDKGRSAKGRSNSCVYLSKLVLSITTCVSGYSQSASSSLLTSEKLASQNIINLVLCTVTFAGGLSMSESENIIPLSALGFGWLGFHILSGHWCSMSEGVCRGSPEAKTETVIWCSRCLSGINT